MAIWIREDVAPRKSRLFGSRSGTYLSDLNGTMALFVFSSTSEPLFSSWGIFMATGPRLRLDIYSSFSSGILYFGNP